MAAEQITITRTRDSAIVVVDGVEIPGHAIPAEDGITVPVTNDDAPRVHLQLIAERVDVVNTIENEEA